MKEESTIQQFIELCKRNQYEAKAVAVGLNNDTELFHSVIRLLIVDWGNGGAEKREHWISKYIETLQDQTSREYLNELHAIAVKNKPVCIEMYDDLVKTIWRHLYAHLDPEHQKQIIENALF